jgi:hypothetical protein
MRNKRLVIVIACFIVFIVSIILLTIVSSFTPEAKIKQVISEEIHRADFDVDEVVMEDGDWMLVKITFTSRDEYSNSTIYNILRKENGNPRLILVLGTDFAIKDMVDADVPKSIIKYLLGDGPHFVDFNFLHGIMRSADGAKVVQQLVTAYSEMKKLDVFIYRLQQDTYRRENLTDYPKFNDVADSFDVTLDNEHTVHVKIISPYEGNVVYELYGEDNELVFNVSL